MEPDRLGNGLRNGMVRSSSGLAKLSDRMMLSVWPLLVCCALFAHSYAQANQAIVAPATERPAHHTDKGFTNPHSGPDTKSFFSYLRMRWFSDEVFANQKKEVDQIRVTAAPEDLARPPSEPRVTWLGHSTFLIEANGRTVLTDPVFSKRASPVSFAGPERLAPTPLDLNDLPSIDVVVISHNHYDHLDEETIRRLGAAPRYVVPLNLADWFVEQGIPRERVIELDWWQVTEQAGMRFTATPVQHWSARGLNDRYDTLWAGWHIDFGGFTTWFAGDTGYNEIQFKEIGARFGGVDLALIPIGAYAPRWFMKMFHVDPAEAIKIHNEVKARFSIGMHWSTFQLTAEPLDEPRQKLEQLVAAGALNQGQFVTLPIGGSTHLSPRKEVARHADADALL